MGRYIIGIDQSTQGTKALLVDEGGHLIHRADRSHRQIVNEAGWVSHDPAEIAANVLAVARAVVEETGVDPADVAGIGISNQRETTVAWRRTTGEPLCDAVVWQCARARELCDELAAREGVAELVRDTTGLVLSPYYPAGKMAWILANVPAAAEAAAALKPGEALMLENLRFYPEEEGKPVPGHHRCLGGLDAHGRRGVSLRLVQCQPHAAL